MIGKKTLRNKDEDNYNSDKSLSPTKNNDKKILNTKEKENINK